MALTTPVEVLAYSQDFEPIRKAHYILELRSNEDILMPEPSKLHISGLGQLTNEIKSELYKPFNSDFELPTGKSVTALNVTLRFFKDKSIYDFFNTWSKAVYNPETDEFGLYDDIVGSGVLKLYGPSERNADSPGSPETPLYEITLQDVWPKAITIESLESDDDGTTPASWSVALSVGMLLQGTSGSQNTD